MRRLLFALLAVVLGFLTALAWYGYDRGLTKKWRNYLVNQFRKEGIEVSLHRLTLDPLRGLVGEEVKLYDAKDKRHVLAVIDRIMLGVNYANAIRGRTFLDSIDLRDAHLTFPLDPADPEGESVTISHLNARLLLPPGQIYLSRAEAEIYGLRVLAFGRLVNPQDFRFQRDAHESPGAVLARVVEELKGLHFEGPHPVLSIQFSGDLAHPEEIFADARLHATDIRRKKYQIQRLDVTAGCQGGIAELKQFDAADLRGEFHACGTYELASHQVALRVQSSLDLQELNHTFHFTGDLGDFFFPDPPQVDCTLQGTLQSAPRLRAFGHLALGNFTFKSEPFTSLAADASWDGEAWSVRDLHLTHRSGELSGDAVQTSGDFRAKLQGKINPKALLPLLSGNGTEWLSQFDFTDAPERRAHLPGKSLEP